MLLQEAMFTPDRAAREGLVFTVKRHNFGNGGYNITAMFPGASGPIGSVSISRSLGVGKCLGAYEVTSSSISSVLDGLGPLLYDIAMEIAGDAGIMSDRRTVSPEARNVWRYYHEKRSDVSHRQLDSMPGVLTPDIEEDDCNQNSANRYEKWQNSALSKVYRKRGTPTIDRLMELGAIVIVDSQTPVR